MSSPNLPGPDDAPVFSWTGVAAYAVTCATLLGALWILVGGC